MAQPTWRQVAPPQPADPPVAIPGAPGALWTQVLEYVAPGKLVRIVAEAGDTWTPQGLAQPCDPDGDPSSTDHTGLPVTRAARGALIGRLGGSTADQTPDDKTMLLFAVGRFCVLQVPDDKRGALFLAVNDKPEAAGHLAGQVRVRVYEAL